MRRVGVTRRSLALVPLIVAGCFDEPPAGGTAAPPPSPSPTSSAGGGGGSPARPTCGEERTTSCARAVHIIAGSWHTCVVMSDGTVRCFGSNASHQLGDPTIPQGAFQGTRLVASVRAPKSLFAGREHTCAILDDASVQCWGRNSLGQLGSGDTQFSVAPRAPDAEAVVGSALDATCTLDAEGAVRCWGLLLNGQRWDRYFGDFRAVPTVVSFPSEVEKLSVASRHACAVLEAGTRVMCWGRNDGFALGHGEDPDSTIPVDVGDTLRTPVHLIAGQAERTCVSAGQPAQVQCWGKQRAAENWPTPTTLPVQPDGEVVDLAVGWSHSCVLLADGRVQCWGLNSRDSLGVSGGDSADPVTVTGIDDAVALAVGSSHSCVIREGGTVACWGSNQFGALNLPPSLASSWQPVAVDLEVAP